MVGKQKNYFLVTVIITTTPIIIHFGDDDEEESEEGLDDDVVCTDGVCTWSISVEDICNWGEGRAISHRYKIGLASDNCCACIMWGVSAPEEEEEEEEDEEVR